VDKGSRAGKKLGVIRALASGTFAKQLRKIRVIPAKAGIHLSLSRDNGFPLSRE
jgi:hypothetical protein